MAARRPRHPPHRRTRRATRWRALTAGLPALLVIAALGGLSWIGTNHRRDGLEARYVAAAQHATGRGELCVARLCYDRLDDRSDLPRTAPELATDRALLLDAQGHEQAAAETLRALAPDSGGGPARAHEWRAGERLRHDATDHEGAARHLRWALRAEPDRASAHLALGRLLARHGPLQLALRHLGLAARQRHDALIHVAEVRKRLGVLLRPQAPLDADALVGRARREAHAVLERYQPRLAAAPDDHVARTQCAHAAVVLDDHARAVRILADGQTLAPRHETYGALMVEVLVKLSDHILARGEQGALRPLERALSLSAWHPAVLDRLERIAVSGGPDAEAAGAALAALRARRDIGFSGHHTLGMMAWRAGDARTARRHLEAARRLPRGRDHPGLANNLAWVLSRSTPRDLPRALTLAQRAVTARPARAAYRDTRGRILMQLGRWSEALEDLRCVLPAVRDKRATHRALARTYTALGLPEMARRHAELAGQE